MRWIPVTERLPNESGSYLVTVPMDNGDSYVDALDYHKGKFYEYDSEWGDIEYDDVLAWMPLPEPYNADRKTENSSEKPNNFAKDINVRSKDKLQTCDTCRFELYCPEMCEGCCEWDSHYEPKDEPQYDIDKGTISCDNCAENGSYKCSKCDGEIYFKRLAVENEPQTEDEVLREQVRAFMGIVEQMKRSE